MKKILKKGLIIVFIITIVMSLYSATVIASSTDIMPDVEGYDPTNKDEVE